MLVSYLFLGLSLDIYCLLSLSYHPIYAKVSYLEFITNSVMVQLLHEVENDRKARESKPKSRCILHQIFLDEIL